MASGKSLEPSPRIQVFRVSTRDKTPRDRSLNGKARIKARKARNKRGW